VASYQGHQQDAVPTVLITFLLASYTIYTPSTLASAWIYQKYSGLPVSMMLLLKHGWMHQGLARLSLESRDKDQDYKCLGLIVKTETEIFSELVSWSRLRSRLPLPFRDDETETEIMNFETVTETQIEVVKTIRDKTGKICPRLETF
jgi:hypothetical protein